MDGIISSISSNLHIVRRLVSGVIILFFAALAFLRAYELRDLDEPLNLLSGFDLLVAILALLCAYLIGSVSEYTSNSIVSQLSGILADVIMYPVRRFSWLQPVLAFLCILPWLIWISLFTVPIALFRRSVLGKQHRISVERHLDREGKALMSKLPSAVQYGLLHPASVHYDHAVEEMLVASGKRRPSVERYLARQADVSIFLGALIFGILIFGIITAAIPARQNVIIPSIDYNGSALEEEEVGGLSEEASPEIYDLDGFQENSTGLESADEDNPEQIIAEPVIEPISEQEIEPVVIVEDRGIFNSPFSAIYAYPPLLLLSFLFIQFRRNAAISMIQTAVNESGAISETSRQHFSHLYPRKSPSKSSKFVSRLMLLFVTIIVPVEILLWFAFDMKHDYFVDLFVGMFGLSESAAAEYLNFWSAVGYRLMWSITVGLAILCYMQVFLKDFAVYSSIYSLCALVMALAYFFVRLCFSVVNEIFEFSEPYQAILTSTFEISLSFTASGIAGLFFICRCRHGASEARAFLIGRLKGIIAFFLVFVFFSAILRSLTLFFTITYSNDVSSIFVDLLGPHRAFVDLSIWGGILLGIVFASYFLGGCGWRRVRWATIHCVWIYFAFFFFENFPVFGAWSDGASITGLNFDFPNGLRVRVGTFFCVAISALSIAISFHYCILASGKK